MSDDKKKICFIDSSYNPLFYIADGENVVLTYSDGERAVQPCKFLDEYHTQVGNNIFHICQFAEIMERNGSTVIPMRSSLPDKCWCVLPDSDEIVAVKKGNQGYCRIDRYGHDREDALDIVAELNEKDGVNKAQTEAMLAGALFGWG